MTQWTILIKTTSPEDGRVAIFPYRESANLTANEAIHKALARIRKERRRDDVVPLGISFGEDIMKVVVTSEWGIGGLYNPS